MGGEQLPLFCLHGELASSHIDVRDNSWNWTTDTGEKEEGEGGEGREGRGGREGRRGGEGRGGREGGRVYKVSGRGERNV